MGNCLVTKLKETVNKDSLHKLGEFKCLWKFVSSGYNSLFVRASAGTVVSCTNLTAFLNENNTERTNPFTTVNNGEYTIKPNVKNDQEGWFSINQKYGIQGLVLSNMKELSDNTSDIIANCPSLVNIGFHNTEIDGDLNELAYVDNLVVIRFSYLSKDYVNELNVRDFINTIASRRQSGTILYFSATNGNLDNGALTDIPKGVNGSNMLSLCTIYFTSDTTTYPHGWYVKAVNNKYYNANDEEIQAP